MEAAAAGGDGGAGGGASGEAGDFPQGGGGGGAARGPRVCRDFASKNACNFGDKCKFSHDLSGLTGADGAAAGGAGGASAGGAAGGAAGGGAVADSYEENVQIQSDMVKFLLKDQGSVIGAIHRRFGTSNERIKNSAFEEFVTITVKGPKENVQAAIKAIEHAIGIEGQQRREARYQYAANELEYNKRAISYLLAGNFKNRGTALELSPATLLAVAQTFRFVPPPRIQHFVIYTGALDKEKNERLALLMKPFTAVQALLFAPFNRLDEMEKRASQLKAVFHDVAPVFVQREHSKVDRMRHFEAFKKGNGPPTDAGAVQRLLVTTVDFAKLARKVQIPYVNLVVHYNASDKETYAHQAMCTGRRGRPGISLLFANQEFSKELVEGLRQDNDVTVLDASPASIAAWNTAVAGLTYDAASQPLTEVGDYPEDNWQEELRKEEERMKAEGIVKKEPPKPKPKQKRAPKKDAAGAAPAASAGPTWERAAPK
jgi:hypothetical protein